MGEENRKVAEFVRRAPSWRNEIQKLRSILLECRLDEDLKWGKPCFSLQGNNVAIIQPFKTQCSLMFFRGALLEDPSGLLRRPGENSRAARRLEFTSEAAIRKNVVKSYVKQAMAIERAGLRIDWKAQDQPEPSPELTHVLQQDRQLERAFRALTPGRQRGYLLHFAGAKQPQTRAARIRRCIPKILAGRGVNER